MRVPLAALRRTRGRHASGNLQEPAHEDPSHRVNNFMATGGDGFSVLLAGSDVLGGAQDIDALTAYLGAGYLAPRPPYDPAQPALALPRITALP